MPSPTANLPSLSTTWTSHAAPSYTEQDPALEPRARAAQTYVDTLGMYAEDTHPDSVRQLESRRPSSLAPTYWQAMGRDSPLPEQVGNTPSIDEDPVSFSPSLSGRALAQAVKHVDRLNHVLEQAEQLGTLLLERDQQGGTSIDLQTVVTLCRKLDQLRSAWAAGAFAGSSRIGTQLASHCAPVPRTLQEDALKALINNLWDVAKTEYRDKYLTDPLNADHILVDVYRLVEGLKNSRI